MKCHYEVLEVSREADDSEIKSSYRKLALKWHPDKNLDNPDYAKEQFQVVQQAYEVLSDKQERAWYDAHRDQILRGANSEFQDNSLDVFQYFTTTCFKGYGDDEKGFYTVYRNVFEHIAKEDLEFIEEKEDFCEIPGFGRSDSDYENVKTFYDYWTSYSTKKSYSWLDPYDIREGKGDRRISKLIEKENKKARQKAKKERNEEIRSLVAFVRKRDRRVEAFKKELEAKTLENRKKQEILSKQKRLQRKQQHENEKQADWLKFDNVQTELEEIEKHLAQQFGEELSNSDEDGSEYLDNLYCVACNKVFKNPKAFQNHESSKKHKENVEKLKETMLEDEMESNLTENSEEFIDVEDTSDCVDQLLDNHEFASGDESIENEDLQPSDVSQHKREKKKRNTQKPREQSDDPSSENDNIDINVDTSEESDHDSKPVSKKSKRKTTKKLNKVVNEAEAHPIDHFDIGKVSDDDFDFGPKRNQKKKTKKSNTKQKENSKAENEVPHEDNFTETKPNIKKPTRKEKKNNKKEVQPEDLKEIDTNHCCVTCKGNFPSKNKLFDHLKKTGHGVYLPTKVKESNKKSSAIKA